MTGLWPEGCVEGLWKRVLKMDRPEGRRVRKFDGAFGPRVVVSLWGRRAARVQKVQRVRPAFGRLVQRVADCRSAVHSEHILKER